jgi:transposase
VAKTQNYSRETREKAVRLVREHAGDYPSEFAAIKAVAARLGVGSAETLRKWVRQAEVDAGEAAGVTTAEAAECRRITCRSLPGRTGPPGPGRRHGGR